MVSSVAGLFLAAVTVRLSSFVVTRQEGDEILGQNQLGGFQLALRRETDGQQGIIKAIQLELMSPSRRSVTRLRHGAAPSPAVLDGRRTWLRQTQR